jgi:hypothetical protein
MAGITTYLSILKLSVSGLKCPIKRHHLANWNNKDDLTFCVYKRLILMTKISTGLGWKAGRSFRKPMAPQNRQA